MRSELAADRLKPPPRAATIHAEHDEFLLSVEKKRSEQGGLTEEEELDHHTSAMSSSITRSRSGNRITSNMAD